MFIFNDTKVYIHVRTYVHVHDIYNVQYPHYTYMYMYVPHDYMYMYVQATFIQ